VKSADGLDCQPGFTGVWIIEDESQAPDIVIYYAHGTEVCHF
jgi:hypothetical protein